VREDVISFLENEAEEIEGIIGKQSTYRMTPEEFEKLHKYKELCKSAAEAVRGYPDIIDVLIAREDEE
jgi:hypothetical protein